MVIVRKSLVLFVCTLRPLWLSFLLAFFFISNPAAAQILKGRITSDSGSAIPYATVYIEELKQGTTSNTKGDYEIRLPAGKYQVIYQSLGYSPVFYTANVSGQTIIKDVVLPVQYYQIPEVRITATGEDPAYGIMRKAIGMAPYYLNNISYYKAEVYLKGNLQIIKIPKLFQKAINAEAKNDEGTSVSSTKIKEGDVYVMESVNEIEFAAPDNYTQKVISVNSTFPSEGDNVSPMDFIEASLYEPQIGNALISPLSPQAFSYYKFRYMGATPQGNYTVNKITVIPKMKSQQLFEGTIFIIEDLWCLHSVDLTNNNIAGKVRFEQIYIPVQNDIWMPVSHKFEINFAMLGIKGDVGYGGSVKYLEVRPNTSLKRPEPLAAKYFAQQNTGQINEKAPVSKNQQKIEKILEKDELTNRDMLTLSKLMEKESEETLPDSVRNNLEVREHVARTVEKDAGKKDSTYWAEIRPVPLSDLEMLSILKRDSLKREELALSENKTDTIPKDGKKKKKKLPKALDFVISGHTWSDTTGFSFAYGGLLKPDNINFNTVDGYTFGQDFRISKNWKNNTGITITPEASWAFSREKLMWKLSGYYGFNRMKQSSLSFRTGITSRDFSSNGPINPLLNSFTSLFLKRNYMKLYETRFLTIGYRTEIRNGLYVDFSGGFEKRDTLENTTGYAIIKSSRLYTDNFPDNPVLYNNPIRRILPDNEDHYEFVTNVTFIPRQKYSLNKGSKIPRGSDWPTFYLMWKHGINEFPDSLGGYKHYDMLVATASKTHEFGAMSEFRWNVRAGGFLDNRNVPFYDFFHFNTQPLPVILNDYHYAFRLPALYSLSTREFFAEAHIKYTTSYLLLKYLPGMSKTLMRENLSLSYLGSRFHKNYTEIGYSISEIFFIGELGVFAGFEDLKFKSAGVRFVLRFN